MGENRRLAVNMFAQFLSFFLSVGINFFLSPYIISKLGRDAYGFMGLANNFVIYSCLITVAVNSMAGRFITISYHEGNIEKANRYYSSTFFANVLFSFILLILSISSIPFLENFINIPIELVDDVKILFYLTFLNTIIGLLGTVWSVSTFVKNRLDLSSVRAIIGDIIRAILIVVLFVFWKPHIWYLSLVTLIITMLVVYLNYRLTSYLTPEFSISKCKCAWKEVKEIAVSGIWNTLSRVSSMLNNGLDLLISNLFLGSSMMGIVSISKTIPSMVLSVGGMICGVFSPQLTQAYARGNIKYIENELKKSIKILGVYTILPLSCVYAYGDVFYSLWLPTENARMLHQLTMIGVLSYFFSLPMQTLWTIFTVTNRVKESSTNLIKWSFLSCIIVLICMFFIDSVSIRLYIIIGISVLMDAARDLIFLLPRGATVLGLPQYYFFPILVRNIICTLFLIGISFLFKYLLLTEYSWSYLIICVFLSGIVALFVSFMGILNKQDRDYWINMIRCKFYN